jgi:uncharacterized membrane protein YraQ (UPF0718 family)
MDIFTIVFWLIATILLFLSIHKDKNKTIKSFKKSRNSLKFMGPSILSIVFLIGLILTYLPPDLISDYFGESSSLNATITSAAVGSITLIPAFVAFPLVASFIELGASIVPGAAFLTTLTMVGVVTYPLEKDKFGRKFAITRNVLSFIFAIFIALLMGVILT